MSDVFLSYKREDELRVGRLVKALEKHGLSVWWDRGLPGGEIWREGIDSALTAARCVVVVWTEASVGPAGGFVKDEAARGASRGVLVPVMLDRIQVPLGFGEIQAIDLSYWRRSPRDPFLLDLVAAIRAKMEGRPVPPAQGPMKRLLRRLAFGSVGTVMLAFAGAIASNTFGLQDRMCAMPVGQPTLSDACGALGLGNRPTSDERIAWEQRPVGSCDALRRHVEHFPQGAYRAIAADRLAARRVTEIETWIATEKPLNLYVGRDARAQSNESLARADALARGQAPAERQCRDFAASGLHRFNTARVEAAQWVCSKVSGGMVCGFEGRSVCILDERHVVEQESCAEAGKS
jgi:hypothetical protein